MAVQPIDGNVLIEWFRPYLHTGEAIPADVVIENIRSMPTITPPNEPLPVLINDEPDREYIDYICPRCKDTISQRRRGQYMDTVYQCKFHDNCGQRVDWSNLRPYRRPPEGGEKK